MRDEEKSKEQLINELVKMRQHLIETETRLKLTEVSLYDCQGKIEYLDSFLTDVSKCKLAEDKLRAAHQQLLDIIEFLPDATFVIDKDKKVIVWNRAIAEMTGVPKEAVMGKGEYAYAVPFYGSPQPILLDLIFSDDLENEKKYAYVARQDNKIIAEKYSRFPFSGNESIMWGVAAPLFDKEGSLVGAIESIRDITKHKQTETALEIERQRLYYVLDKLPAFVCLIAADYSIPFANLYFRKRFGEPKEKPCYELHHRQKEPCTNCPPIKVLKTNIPVEWEWTALDGRVYQVCDYPFDDMDGTKLVLELMIDITESELIKEALEISEANHRAIVEDQAEFICRHAPEGTITFVNEAYCRYFGKNREVLLGSNFMSSIAANDLQQLEKHFSSINAKNPVASIELNILMPWGENRWQHWTNRAIFNEQGQLVEFQSVGHDITKRKLAEQALQESETKYRTLVERIPALIYIAALDETSTTIYISPQVETILGFTQADYEAEPETWYKQLHPDDRTRVLNELSLFYDGNESFHSEYRMFARDGRMLWIKDEANITRDTDGQPLYVQGIMFDITQQKQVEEALRTSEERFYKAFNASPILMAIISIPSKRFIDVNESWLNIMGYKREEVLNRTIYDRNIKENITLYEKISKARDQWPINNMEITFYTKYGEKRAGLFSGDLVFLGDESCFLSIIQDVTEKVQFSKEMARLDRLNLVGEMAAGIGHEIRNPMTSVRGFLQIFCGRKEFAPYKEHLELMIEELDRANLIITEFLSLAKNKIVVQKAQNLNHIVQALSPLIIADGMVTDKHIEFELNDIPEIALDDKEIRQLILNLVRNGFEAMSPGGKMKIKTFRDKSVVVLAVQDPGKGIEPDVLEKLGTPFFTTKDNGTGLGLAMCYSIAARHNAKIQVETGPSGTTFLVRFKL